MAKIVSEKRELVARPSAPISSTDAEAPSSPLVSLFGIVLTVIFLGGAAAMVFVAFTS